MKLPPIILWSVFDLIRRGDSLRTRGFLLQLTRVRFPNRRAILIRIKQGQGHCTGAGPPLITTWARHAHTAQGAGAKGRGGAAGMGRQEGGDSELQYGRRERRPWQSPGGAARLPQDLLRHLLSVFIMQIYFCCSYRTVILHFSEHMSFASFSCFW